MTNDELAEAIKVASERLQQTGNGHSEMWAAHLRDLLAVQALRARAPEPINMMPGSVLGAENTMTFRRWPPRTADDPLGQKVRP